MRANTIFASTITPLRIFKTLVWAQHPQAVDIEPLLQYFLYLSGFVALLTHTEYTTFLVGLFGDLLLFFGVRFCQGAELLGYVAFSSAWTWRISDRNIIIVSHIGLLALELQLLHLCNECEFLHLYWLENLNGRKKKDKCVIIVSRQHVA